MTDPGVTELVGVLQEVRERFNCDQIAASYVSPAGVLVTLTVLRSLVTVSDDNGNVHLVEQA